MWLDVFILTLIMLILGTIWIYVIVSHKYLLNMFNFTMVQYLHCVGSWKECKYSRCEVTEALNWPKLSFFFFCNILGKNSKNFLANPINERAWTECGLTPGYTMEMFESFFLTYKSLVYLWHVSPESEHNASN